MQETHRVCSSGVIFDLEQVVSGKVRESNKPMGKATKSGHEFDTEGKQHQRCPNKPGRLLFNSG